MEAIDDGTPSVTAVSGCCPSGEPLNPLLASDLDAGFAEVVRAHKRLLYTVLVRACGDHGDAEDLTAEAFLRAYRALRTYDRERIQRLRLRPWLVTIALNAWRNLARDRSRQPRQVSLDQAPHLAADGDEVDRLVRRTDDQRALARLIAELPERQRVAIVLRHVCELPVSEVAEALGVPEGTLRSLVSRGLSKIRERADIEGHEFRAAEERTS